MVGNVMWARSKQRLGGLSGKGVELMMVCDGQKIFFLSLFLSFPLFSLFSLHSHHTGFDVEHVSLDVCSSLALS